MEYTFSLLFDDRSINIMAYNIETILAEKLETVLSRNVANTRPRDFYDIYILYKLRGHECSIDTLKLALEKTTEKRGSSQTLPIYKKVVADILESDTMQGFWKKYCKGRTSTGMCK